VIGKSTKEIYDNRYYISTISETLELLGRQGWALRGSEDSGRISIENPDENKGGFLALLSYHARGGDTILEEYLKLAPGNPMYTSPSVPNESLYLIGEDIQNNVLKRVCEAKWYAVLADGTLDVAKIEQLSICLTREGTLM